jgi:transposase
MRGPDKDNPLYALEIARNIAKWMWKDGKNTAQIADRLECSRSQVISYMIAVRKTDKKSFPLRWAHTKNVRGGRRFWENERGAILKHLNSGVTAKQLSVVYGVTRERIRQVIAGYGIDYQQYIDSYRLVKERRSCANELKRKEELTRRSLAKKMPKILEVSNLYASDLTYHEIEDRLGFKRGHLASKIARYRAICPDLFPIRKPRVLR